MFMDMLAGPIPYKSEPGFNNFHVSWRIYLQGLRVLMYIFIAGCHDLLCFSHCTDCGQFLSIFTSYIFTQCAEHHAYLCSCFVLPHTADLSVCIFMFKASWIKHRAYLCWWHQWILMSKASSCILFHNAWAVLVDSSLHFHSFASIVVAWNF